MYSKQTSAQVKSYLKEMKMQTLGASVKNQHNSPFHDVHLHKQMPLPSRVGNRRRK